MSNPTTCESDVGLMELGELCRVHPDDLAAVEGQTGPIHDAVESVVSNLGELGPLPGVYVYEL